MTTWQQGVMEATGAPTWQEALRWIAGGNVIYVNEGQSVQAAVDAAVVMESKPTSARLTFAGNPEADDEIVLMFVDPNGDTVTVTTVADTNYAIGGTAALTAAAFAAYLDSLGHFTVEQSTVYVDIAVAYGHSLYLTPDDWETPLGTVTVGSVVSTDVIDLASTPTDIKVYPGVTDKNYNSYGANVRVSYVDDVPQQLFLLSCFMAGGTAPDLATQKLGLWKSMDGVNFTNLKADGSYLHTLPVSDPQKYIVDRSILYYRGKWYCAYFTGVESNRNLGLLVSSDLITWTDLVADGPLLVGDETNSSIWCPKWFVDSTGKVYVLYIKVLAETSQYIDAISPVSMDPSTWDTKAGWGSPVTIDDNNNTDIDSLDCDIIKLDGTYHLIQKNESNGAMQHRVSASLLTGYTTSDVLDWAGWSSGEQPSLVRMANGGVRIYYSKDMTTIYYSDNFDGTMNSWTTPAPIDVDTFTPTHGQVIRITDPALIAYICGVS